MFMHIFVNRIKIMLGEKLLIFWTLIFPIVLGTLFYMAFSNLSSAEKFEVIEIAIVEETKTEENSNFKTMMDSLSKEDENKVFNITYVDKDKANSLLVDGEISRICCGK